jgi:hypothetical protein
MPHASGLAGRWLSISGVRHCAAAVAFVAGGLASYNAAALSAPLTPTALSTVTITAVTPQLNENIKDIGTLKVERSQTQTLKIPSSAIAGILSGPTAALNTPLAKGTAIAYIVYSAGDVKAANANVSTLPANATPIVLPDDGTILSLQKNIGDAIVPGTTVLGSFSNLNYTDSPLTVAYSTSGSNNIVVPNLNLGVSLYLSGPYAPTDTPLQAGDVIAYLVSISNEVLGVNEPLPSCYDINTNTSTPPCTFNPVAQLKIPQDGTVLSLTKSPGAQFQSSGGDTIGTYSIAGKAAPGVDYVPLPGLVVIPSGQSSATFELIPMEDDDPADGDEDVTISVSANSAYTVGSPGSAVINLVEGPAVTVTTTPASLVISGSGVVTDPAKYTFTRKGDTTQKLTFQFNLTGTAVKGSDYSLSGTHYAAPNKITIPSGQTTADLTVTAIANGTGVKTVTIGSLALPLLAYVDGFFSGPLANAGNPVSVGKPLAYVVSSMADVVAADGCTCDLPADAIPIQMPQFGTGTTGVVTDFTFVKNVGDDVTNGDKVATLTVPQTVKSTTITIANTLVSPAVSIVPNQGGSDMLLIAADGGNVTATAAVTDVNPGDTFIYDWSATDNALVPLSGTTNSTFDFDPSALTPGFYTLRVTVMDSSGMSTAVDRLIDVVATLPNLDQDAAEDTAGTHAEDDVDDVQDSDGDGIPDATEGYTDTDNDGIPDFTDSSKLFDYELQEVPMVADNFLIVTEPNYTLRAGDVAFAAGNTASIGDVGAAVTLNDIAQYGGAGATPGINPTDTFTPWPSNVDNPYVDFTISGLYQEGQSARVVIALQTALPPNSTYRYRVYHPSSGWRDFQEDTNNAIASCCTQASLAQNNAGNHGNFPGSNGNCPAPGSSDYQTGLSEGSMCLELTIQDGGPNDTDGVANHVITDPSVVTYKSNPVAPAGNTVPSSSGGGTLAAPTLLTLLGMFIAGVRRRRIRY